MLLYVHRLRRPELPDVLSNVFNRVYGYLNCNDSNTDVLSATNACAKHSDDPDQNDYSEIKDNLDHNGDPDHKDKLDCNDDPDHNDDSDHNDNPDTSKTNKNSEEFATVDIPTTAPGVADSKHFAVHSKNFTKMNTIRCSTNTNKSPHKVLRVAHAMPNSIRFVNQPFGVHPYAVVDLQKVREFSYCNCNFLY